MNMKHIVRVGLCSIVVVEALGVTFGRDCQLISAIMTSHNRASSENIDHPSLSLVMVGRRISDSGLKPCKARLNLFRLTLRLAQ